MLCCHLQTDFVWNSGHTGPARKIQKKILTWPSYEYDSILGCIHKPREQLAEWKGVLSLMITYLVNLSTKGENGAKNYLNSVHMVYG